MKPIIKLYSDKKGEILKFLNKFYRRLIPSIENDLLWEKEYDNPIEIADMVGVLIGNNEDYKINIWISLGKGLFININDNNINDVIKYLYERYPY